MAFRLTIDSLIRQRRNRIITNADKRLAMALDEVIRLRLQEDYLRAEIKKLSKPVRKKKETTDDSGDAASE